MEVLIQKLLIIKGICAGLHYLHMEKCILHMDLKPGNILLDKQMMPKITDFGLSRPTENSQTMTTTHFASLGYTAPENMFGCGRMSVKSDIYSLGVIIIELVTGHKGIPDDNNNILRRWRHRWNKSMKEIPQEYHQQVTKCIKIGSLCQKTDPYSRPSVSEIMDFFVEMESTTNQMVDQVNLPFWEDDMLGVEPLELQFVYSMNKQILSCSVELNNSTNCSIAFDIQTTGPLPYSIVPNKDIVKPQSKCSVYITLSADNKRNHKASLQYGAGNKQYTEEFIVRSAKVSEGFTSMGIVQDMFDKHAVGHHVDEIHLTVASGEPCSKEAVDFKREQAKKQNPSPDNSSEELTTTQINDEEPIDASLNSGARARRIGPGTMQLVIKNNRTAPLLEHKKKVMLELTGGDYTGDRPGLDLVALVDLTRTQGKKIHELKTALRFVVQKLSPMDRLSVITFDSGAITLLYPLRQITEASQRELQDLINKLVPQSVNRSSIRKGIMKGLQMGIDALADREVRVGRVSGIILISDGSQRDADAIPVDVGNVPVYTFGFGFGGVDRDPMALNTIADKSMGGTFYHVLDQETGGLTMALSQCLAGLLTVAVQNLELTVAAVDGESKIVKVTAGSYPQVQHVNSPAGSVTVSFGNLYSKEVRKVIVDVLLPAIHSERSADILDITYSHNSSAGRTKFVAPTKTLIVWRAGGELLEEEEKLAGLQAEVARLQIVEWIKMARSKAKYRMLDGARDNLVKAQNMLEAEQPNSSLRTELQELFELLKTQETYRKQGLPYMLSLESSHERQRLVRPGGDIEVMRLFATPLMDMYLEQAKKFLTEPTIRLQLVDDDVKEELDVLTIDGANREEEMRRLGLDLGRAGATMEDRYPRVVYDWGFMIGAHHGADVTPRIPDY
uniref:Uncharacterized protein n=1 Tax=Avena sativa TaxID=4498 RepID=A0ACD5WKQ4_AVESA